MPFVIEGTNQYCGGPTGMQYLPSLHIRSKSVVVERSYALGLYGQCLPDVCGIDRSICLAFLLAHLPSAAILFYLIKDADKRGLKGGLIGRAYQQCIC